MSLKTKFYLILTKNKKAAYQIICCFLVLLPLTSPIRKFFTNFTV